MGKLEFESLGGVYVLNWAQEMVRMKIDRLRDDNRGDVTGEVWIITTAPDVPPHLHRARFNLTSTKARQELAKHLYTRYPLRDGTSESAWPAMLEQACFQTLKSYREGEPVVKIGNLGDDAPILPVEYQLHPLLLKKQPTVLFGDGGVGKSYMAVLAGLTVQHGWLELGWRPVKTETLYLDYETDQDTLMRRTRMVLNGLGARGQAWMHYRRCFQSLADDIDEIQRIVAENKIGLVIVDSLGMAVGGDLEKPSEVLRFFSALRFLNVTSLLLTHNSKNSEKKTPFGSVYFINYARSVFELMREQNIVEDGVVSLGLYHRKVNDGPLMNTSGYHMRFKEDAVSFERADVSLMPELSKSLPAWDRIVAALKAGPATIKELAEELGVKQDTIKKTLDRYSHKGSVRRREDSKWTLGF